MSAERHSFAFISLLRDDAEARGLADLLEGLARPGASAASVFLVPGVRGLDFFAASASQAALDRWWGGNVPAGALPVFLLQHETGLAAWMLGLDGVFLVAVGDTDAAGYSPAVGVRRDADGAPLALAEAVVTRYGTAPNPASATAADVFDVRDVRMIARVRAGAAGTRSMASAGAHVQPTGNREPVRPYSHQGLPPLFDVAGGASPPATAASAASPPADPLELLAAESERAEGVSPAWSSSRSAATSSFSPAERPHRGGAAATTPATASAVGRRRQG
ncbi:MAG: hypothetical protein ABI352_09160 [Candidatus Dormibacter sp.]